MHILWTSRFSGERLKDLAALLVAELEPHERFCLWLSGGLGAGKTTLTGVLLHHLGLPEDEPVPSPTYTYMNEYEVEGHWYAHLDLYRMQGRVSPEDMGLADARRYRGLFIEWPEKDPDDLYLAPTHSLSIAFTNDPAERLYTLTSYG